jgi:hypothetical protein
MWYNLLGESFSVETTLDTHMHKTFVLVVPSNNMGQNLVLWDPGDCDSIKEKGQ